MAKLPPLPRLKKRLWVIFSQYIRQRDADENGYAPCISCGKVEHYKLQDAGHYHPKSLGLSVYFLEKGVHNQCLTKESNLKMFNGTYKSIADVRVGEFIWAFNESGFSLEKAVVEKYEKFIPDLLYEIELEDGKKFYATGDHLVVSNGEWVSVEDMLHNVSAHDIMEL